MTQRLFNLKSAINQKRSKNLNYDFFQNFHLIILKKSHYDNSSKKILRRMDLKIWEITSVETNSQFVGEMIFKLASLALKKLLSLYKES